MANWVEISEDQAKKHPLYGVGGWAGFLIFALIFSGIMSLGVGYDSGIPTYRSLGVISLVANLFCIILLWIHHKAFQPVITVIFIAFPIIGIIISVNLGADFSHVLGSSLGSAILAVAWLSYIWNSVRINVTCRHLVKQTDVTLEKEKMVSPSLESQPEPVSENRPAVKAGQEAIGEPMTTGITREQESEFFARALKEIEDNQKDPGDWARAFAEAEGEAEKAKALYIKERVATLTEMNEREIEEQKLREIEEEQKKRFEEEERRRKIAIENASLWG